MKVVVFIIELLFWFKDRVVLCVYGEDYLDFLINDFDYVIIGFIVVFNEFICKDEWLEFKFYYYWGGLRFFVKEFW